MNMKSLTLMLAAAFAALSTQAQNHWPASGSAGIGTSTTPTDRFEIRDAATSYLKFTRSSDLLGTVGGLKFELVGTELGRIELERTVGSNRLSSYRFFLRNMTNASTPTEVMRMDDSGYVRVFNRFNVGGKIGIGAGVGAPGAQMHVHAPQNTPIAVFTHGDVLHSQGFVEITNATYSPGIFLPYIKGRGHNPGHTFGLYLVGESDDIVSPVAFEAAMILDGRTKSNTRLNNANVLAINSMGVNLAVVKADGSMGIGTPVTHGHKLAVNGSGLFTKVVVKQQSAWPDFVFSPGYRLRPLSELAAFIQQNKHLPEIPSAAEVARDGQDLGEINRKLLQKVEELTLYIIEQDKARKSVEERLAALEAMMERLK